MSTTVGPLRGERGFEFLPLHRPRLRSLSTSARSHLWSGQPSQPGSEGADRPSDRCALDVGIKDEWPVQGIVQNGGSIWPHRPIICLNGNLDSVRRTEREPSGRRLMGLWPGRPFLLTQSGLPNNVKILVGLGIPQKQICRLVINPQTGRPLDQKTLRKHFAHEIEIGTAEVHARIASFMVGTIFGTPPPAGTVVIHDQQSRASFDGVFRQDADGLARDCGGPPQGACRRSDRISGCGDNEASNQR